MDAGDPLERLQKLAEQLEQASRSIETQVRRDDEQRAEAARRGDLGVDWQRVQQRIDRGQTSLDAVFGGQDSSAEAERLRGHATRHLQEMPPPDEQQAGELDASLHALTVARERLGHLLGVQVPSTEHRPRRDR